MAIMATHTHHTARVPPIRATHTPARALLRMAQVPRTKTAQNLAAPMNHIAQIPRIRAALENHMAQVLRIRVAHLGEEDHTTRTLIKVVKAGVEVLHTTKALGTNTTILGATRAITNHPSPQVQKNTAAQSPANQQ